MTRYRIAVIPGDGIGPEVLQQSTRVLELAAKLDGGFSFSFQQYPWGCEYYRQHGRMMDDDGIDRLSQSDAILLGAVGAPDVPDHISLWELLLKIRHEFDQYVNLRPVRLLRGAPCPLRDVPSQGINMTVIRENSEGEYAGAGERLYRGRPEEVALQTGVFSRRGTQRIMRYAFEQARRERRTLTSISKGNALNHTMVFWDEMFHEVARDYPDVKTTTLLVDAAAMFFVRDPGRFQVVVASNLFGDILTDLGAAIAGGMGLAAGANLNPERRFPSMFEPIHGSAPDIAGKGLANPLAAIWSAGQMLAHLGYAQWEHLMLEVMEDLLVQGSILTPDLGGNACTAQVGDTYLALLAERFE